MLVAEIEGTHHYLSKAIANTKAVNERQALQTISREEKTSLRQLTSLKEARTNMEEKKNQLDKETETLKERKKEVSVLSYKLFTGHTLTLLSQLNAKIGSLRADLAKAKQELSNQQSEFARIRSVVFVP